MSFYIKQNDTLPSLESQLLNASGTPINLEMSGVLFHMRDSYGRKELTKIATIVDAENGQVKIDWNEGDTGTVGIYKCEFQVTFTDNTILTIPNDGYFLIYIVEELG